MPHSALHATSNNDLKRLNQREQLSSLIAGTWKLIGEEFFQSFAQHLAEAYGAQYAICNELIDDDPTKVRTLAYWQNGKLGDNFEYEVRATPCECVYKNGLSYFPKDIQTIFDEDENLVQMGVNSYYGIPLTSQQGEIIGHICIFGATPLAETDYAEEYFRIFAGRASSELQRLKVENELVKHRDNLKALVDEKTASLRKAKELTERAIQAKSIFLSRMSHELNTPMNAILGFAELMKDDIEVLSDDHKEYISKICETGWHLNSMIREILDISKIEVGEIETKMVVCDVKSALDECIKRVNSKATIKKINIRFDNELLPNAHVLADKARLKQIFTHLLTNAIKFNIDNGSVIINISKGDNDAIRVSVSDTGLGIAEEDKNKVFHKFERLESDKACIAGTGIGLALTKRLVEHMGGKIGLSSEVGKGSTFWVEFFFNND